MTVADEKKQPLGRVLVVGGNGFLGSHIVRKLLDEWDTTAVGSVDLRTTANRFAGVDYHDADITSPDALKAAFEAFGPDVVIHTASPTAVESDEAVMATKLLFYKVNVLGTQNVIEACQATGVKGLVFTSSASIISDSRSDLVNADERFPVIRGEKQPHYYTETKAAAEELVLRANRQEPHRLLTAAIRPSAIFGENDSQVMRGTANILRAKHTRFQIGDNENIFDYTYVGNAAHAHLLAARHLLAAHASGGAPPDHERVDGEAFLVTNDEPIYFWDFFRAAWRSAGLEQGPEHVWVMPSTLGYALGLWAEVVNWLTSAKLGLSRKRINFSTMTRYYNISKAKRVLGYSPQVNLWEGIQRGMAWFQQHHE